MPRILSGIIAGVLLLNVMVSAQEFLPGLKAGFNLSSFYGEDVPSDDKSIKGGLTGGAFLRIDFSEKFGMQPELLYYAKGVNYIRDGAKNDYIRLHYLEIPVMFNYYLPASELLTAYFSFGPYVSALIEAQEGGQFLLVPYDMEIVTNEYKSVDFGLSAGFGTQFDIGSGDIIVDFRADLGLTGLYDHDNIDMNNISFALTVGYAFRAPMLMGHRSENVQSVDAAYLRFVGNGEGVEIQVDEGSRFLLKPTVTKYEIEPGKHSIKIYRDGQLALRRDIYIGNHETKEISLP